MTTVRHWTGREAKALRAALRLSIRDFAEHLGIGTRTITKWEARGPNVDLRPANQAALDTALERASDEAKARFTLLTQPEPPPTVTSPQQPTPAATSPDPRVDPSPAGGAGAADRRLGWQPADPEDVGRSGIRVQVARAAHESQAFLARWESRCLSPATAEEFAEELSRLAADYVHRPLDGIFDDLVAVRDRACGLLGEQRRTTDTRGLLFVAGLACGMLAHASIDLGDRRSAARQARVAARLATEAGHNGLLAWVLGTQSLIAYCLRVPDKAVEFASKGQAVAASGRANVRLAALTARAYAMQHNAPAAKLALGAAEAARHDADEPDLDAMGGILAFPPAKQHYYAASTAALVADGVAAEAYAQQAIAAYENGPEEQRSYGDLALSRVYLAQAQLIKPKPHQDLAAATDALRIVLELPPEQRIAGLHRPLRRTQAQLDQGRWHRSREAALLSTEIDYFLTATPALGSA